MHIKIRAYYPVNNPNILHRLRDFVVHGYWTLYVHMDEDDAAKFVPTLCGADYTELDGIL